MHRKHGILQGYSLEKTLLLSSMTAALSVAKPGGRKSKLLLEDVIQALDAYDRYQDPEDIFR